jgi:NAD(P)-dependent dehydrogenase (short-subunit alcohol dehydrogenase family)
MTISVDLAGRTALVTGASSGLGRQFALSLARCGARVAIAARRTDRLAGLRDELQAVGAAVLPVVLDVTDVASIDGAVETIERELGPIDILVNNSGVSVQKTIVDCTVADYAHVLDTNLRGSFFVAQAVGKRMIAARREGRIVNIASVLGLRVAKQLSLYAMSKAGAVQMTKAMALEWARYDINVNAICPGYIRTEMNDSLWDTEAGARLVATFPRRRLGLPTDLEGALLLLVAPESRMMTGAILSVDDALGIA